MHKFLHLTENPPDPKTLRIDSEEPSTSRSTSSGVASVQNTERLKTKAKIPKLERRNKRDKRMEVTGIYYIPNQLCIHILYTINSHQKYPGKVVKTAHVEEKGTACNMLSFSDV